MGSQKKRLLMALAGLVLIGMGYLIVDSYYYVSTDNAQVHGHTTLLSAKVTGVVVRSNVEENQKVKAGKVLAELESSDYQAILQQRQSELGSLQAQLREADLNYKRFSDLYKKAAVSRQQFEMAEANFKSLNRKVEAALALVHQAEINFKYTQIKAPTDGHIAKKSIEEGMLANSGQALFGFVEANERWVVANFKETDMTLIHPGKKAFVDVDALSGRRFEAEVESISPATGAIFSLLPPDNATGNFTKVVQRVPVRIKLLDLKPEDSDRLQAGLSAVVTVKVH